MCGQRARIVQLQCAMCQQQAYRQNAMHCCGCPRRAGSAAVVHARGSRRGFGRKGNAGGRSSTYHCVVFTPDLGFGSNIFAIEALGKVRETVRRIRTVVDRGDAGPRVLYWRVE